MGRFKVLRHEKSILLLGVVLMISLFVVGCGGTESEPAPAPSEQEQEQAQEAPTETVFPERDVRIAVGSGPGSTMDLLARGLAPRLQDYWGVPVIVDNIPGANQSNAYMDVARDDPDGHSLYIGVGNTIGVHDALGTIDVGWQEFEWFGVLILEANTIFVDARSDIEDFEDFINYGHIRYGDGGYESAANFTSLNIFDNFDMDFTFTPGYDPSAAYTAVIQGEQDFVVRGPGFFHRQGLEDDFRPIVSAATERHVLLPDTPTFAELADQYDKPGFQPRAIDYLSFLIGTTPGTDPEIVDKLAEALEYLYHNDAQFQKWKEDNGIHHDMDVNNIGRDVAQRLVDDMTVEYREANIPEAIERLQQ